jgi:hypothetical protein
MGQLISALGGEQYVLVLRFTEPKLDGKQAYYQVYGWLKMGLDC